MVQEITAPKHRQQVIDIGSGLSMRWSTSADAKNVAELVGDAFRFSSFGDKPDDELPGKHEPLMCCVRRLLSGHSLAMSEYDYALVENTRAAPGQNPIVACAALHEIPSYYGCVKMNFGKPEQIACHRDYRNRGLVRKLMLEMIHPESEHRGHVIQYMPGIDYFYRQFGYEYALSSPDGREMSDLDSNIPKLEKGKQERYNLREAVLDDVPYLMRLSANKEALFLQKTAVGSAYDERYWRYFVHDIYQSPHISWYDNCRTVTIIRDEKEGRDIGFNQHVYMNGLGWQKFALEEGVAIRDVIYPVMRQMVALAQEQAKACHEYEMSKKKEKKEEKKVEKKTASEGDDSTSCESEKPPEISTIVFELSQEHPALEFLSSMFDPAPDEPDDMLYTRISDYAAFITKVAPALEERLTRSRTFAGISVTLQLHFFKKVEGMNAPGLEIVFENGKIVKAQDWKKPTPEQKVEAVRKRKEAKLPEPRVFGAQFYPLIFTQLLMGSRSARELIWANKDNAVKDSESHLFLDVLFPKVEHDIDLLVW
ncbi:hypothetical protein BGZ52_003536 [Haplosporangium bisporale]|nr:hypothetical protein BGZ52_003536 [Haplosporangium bisporale]